MAGGGATLQFLATQCCGDGREHCSSRRYCDIVVVLVCGVIAVLADSAAAARDDAVALTGSVAAACNTAAACGDVATLAGNAAVALDNAAALVSSVAVARGNATALADNAATARDAVAASQCFYDGRQRAGPRNDVVMANSVLQPWPMLCCKVLVFFFLPDDFKRKKEWEKERSFNTCSLVSRLRLSRLRWL
jgi:hypothetical protein